MRRSGWKVVAGGIVVVLLAACGGGGSGASPNPGTDPTPPPPDPLAPQGFAYGEQAPTWWTGMGIVPLQPSTTGGDPVTSYSVAPPLPAGLILDGGTGVISGIPVEAKSLASYVVTAANAHGQATAELRLAVSAPVMVSEGYNHSCAVVAGAAWCWGENGHGQLGNGSTSPSVPTLVQGLEDGVEAIGAGGFFTCALVRGAVLCWGYGEGGVNGDPAQMTRTTPGPVVGLESGVTALAVGSDYACALVRGVVECWGENFDGRLGDGGTEYYRATAAPVAGLPDGVEMIAANAGTCAVVRGALWCWGSIEFLPSRYPRVPTLVPGFESGVQSVAVGGLHVCALVNGAVKCFGEIMLELGAGTWKDGVVTIAGLTGEVRAIAAGDVHTCAVVGDGVQCWGNNEYGQLSGIVGADSKVPVPVSGLADLRALSAGRNTTCVDAGGQVMCWGSETAGSEPLHRVEGLSP